MAQCEVLGFLRENRGKAWNLGEIYQSLGQNLSRQAISMNLERIRKMPDYFDISVTVKHNHQNQLVYYYEALK